MLHVITILYNYNNISNATNILHSYRISSFGYDRKFMIGSTSSTT